MKPKGNNEQAQKCDRYGYNAHKPREKCPAKNESEKLDKTRKIRHFPKCAEVGKALLTCWIKWTIQEKNIPAMSKVLIGTYILQLLHVASLEIDGINANQNVSEKDEWCEFLEVTLVCKIRLEPCQEPPQSKLTPQQHQWYMVLADDPLHVRVTKSSQFLS